MKTQEAVTRETQCSIIVEILRVAKKPLTGAEVAMQMCERLDAIIPESTCFARLNELSRKRIVTNENPKRRCSVNPAKVKKTWSLARPMKPVQVEMW